MHFLFRETNTCLLKQVTCLIEVATKAGLTVCKKKTMKAKIKRVRVLSNMIANRY